MAEFDLPALYLKTVVSIEEGGQLISARDSALVASQVVHVITAWNPGDDRPTCDENDAANARLFAALVELGCEPVRALGSDPDSEHFEESLAVTGLTDDQVREIGARFGQVAVFRLSNGLQTVLACREIWQRSRTL